MKNKVEFQKSIIKVQCVGLTGIFWQKWNVIFITFNNQSIIT